MMQAIIGIIIGVIVGNFFGRKAIKDKLFNFLLDEYKSLKKFVNAEEIRKNTEIIESEDSSEDIQKKKLDIITTTAENSGKAEILKRILDII